MGRHVTRREVLGVMGLTLAGDGRADTRGAGPRDGRTESAGRVERDGTGVGPDPPTIADAAFTRWLPTPAAMADGTRYTVDAVEAPDEWPGQSEVGTLPVLAEPRVERELVLATHRSVVSVQCGPVDRDHLLDHLGSGRSSYERIDLPTGAPTFLRAAGRSVRLAAVTDGALVVGVGREQEAVRDIVTAVLAARAGRVPRYVETDDAFGRVAGRVPVGDAVVLDPSPDGLAGNGAVAVAESVTVGEEPTLRTALTVGDGGATARTSVERAGGRPVPLPPDHEPDVEFVDDGRTAVATARLERIPGATGGQREQERPGG